MRQMGRKLLLVLLAGCLLLSLAACSSDDKNIPTDIVNGDFEDVSTGAWVGWTRQDAAFNFRGVVNTDKTRGVDMEKSGDY